MNKEIHEVCRDCGRAANYLTCFMKYHEPPIVPEFPLSTYHIGICEFCKREEMVTEARDFFYPDFVLLSQVIEIIKQRVSLIPQKKAPYRTKEGRKKK